MGIHQTLRITMINRCCDEYFKEIMFPLIARLDKEGIEFEHRTIGLQHPDSQDYQQQFKFSQEDLPVIIVSNCIKERCILGKLLLLPTFVDDIVKHIQDAL